MVAQSASGNKNTGNDETVTIAKEEYNRLKEVAGLVEVRSEDGESAALEDIWVANQPVGKIIESTRKDVREIGSSEENSKGESGENHPTEDELLPIEQMAALEESDENHPALPKNGRASFDRAMTIFRHFEEWSDKAPKGKVIKQNLKKLVETATGESLFWKSVYRACRKLEEWSQGAITFKKTSRHGWILIGDERLPSAGSG